MPFIHEMNFSLILLFVLLQDVSALKSWGNFIENFMTDHADENPDENEVQAIHDYAAV